MHPSHRHYAIRIDEDGVNRRGTPADLRERKYPTRPLRERVRAAFGMPVESTRADT